MIENAYISHLQTSAEISFSELNKDHFGLDNLVTDIANLLSPQKIYTYDKRFAGSRARLHRIIT